MGKKDRPFQIAILLYPGVTALDAVGPWEVFSRLPHTEVRFVGKDIGPVRTEGGTLLLGVTHRTADTPSPDVVLVPGGLPLRARWWTTSSSTGYGRST